MRNLAKGEATFEADYILDPDIGVPEIRVRLKKEFEPKPLGETGHNHPAGGVKPSPDDVQMTRDLIAGGRLVGFEV